MNSVKNLTLILCLFFLIGCIKFSSTSSDLKNFNLNNVKIDEDTYPVVIIGGGFGGLTAGIYTGQANIKNLLVTGKTPGGAITMSHSVCNWPGEKNISGMALAKKLEDHARKSGANFLQAKVKEVDFSVWPYLIKIKSPNDKSKVIKALSCIIATGAKPVFLNIPGEQKYFGKGVSKCATCDGPLYKNKVVAVIGGGNTAITDASYLSNIAKKVYLIVRRNKLRAKGKVVNEVVSKSNVEILYNTNVKEVIGDGNKITSLKIYNNQNKTTSNLNVDGMFLAIGSIPNSRLFKNKLEMDTRGYILLNKDQQTSKSGVFAVGDVCEPEFKQLVIAAGQGAKAAMQVQKFLENIGYDPTKFSFKEKNDIRENHKESKSGQVIEIKNIDQFKKEVLNYNGKVVVDFYAHWCYPCKMMMPIVKKMAQVLPNIKFVKADISKVDSLGNIWGVRSVPTFLLFKNGKEIYRFTGGKKEEEFKKIIINKF
ncbi:thioredoxin fold domain-containing protein [Candidatus Dependentiae bacterium]|nr:thioredoxin fold domain-containing protein [Candidatus Dependentiae bacterium]